MFRRLVLTALALVSAGIFSAASAQRSGENWVRLGSREIDLSRDSATVDVLGAKGAFKALRLQTPKGDVVITNVKVDYAGGKSHNETRRINLLEGERTRPINPGTADLFVDNVTLTITPNRGKVATVEVWGLQSAAGAKLERPKTPAAAAPPASGTIAATPTPSAPTTAKAGDVLPGGEVLFGAQRVGFGVDRDVIQIGSEIGQFDKVRLRVLENDIFINDLTVVYMNGEKDTLAVNAEIKQNTRTRWFQLKGDRFIKEIQMTYRSRANFKGQARIEVFGEYAEGWLGPQGRGRQFNQGWVLLGAQTAGFLGFDNDLVPVGRNEGGFKRIRITVRDRAITLDQVRVVYANGQDDVVPINRQKVEAGQTYGPIDLKGGTRAIKEIRAKYRSRFLDRQAVGKGAAIVEVWGQH